MDDNDHIITAYRDHGHASGVGMGMNELMAENFGKYTGCSKGKGGSMHYFDRAAIIGAATVSSAARSRSAPASPTP